MHLDPALKRLLLSSALILAACDSGGTSAEAAPEGPADGAGGAAHDGAGGTAGPDAEPSRDPDAARPVPDAAPPLPDAAPPEAPPPEVWGSSLLADENPAPGVFEATLVAGVHTMTLDDGTTLEMWLYNGQFPGPRIDVKAGERVIVHFRNELPEATTIHWHGLRISDLMDGNPRIQDPVAPGGTFDYDFVVPEAGTFWYHPHVQANEQVERGLYAPLFVREPAEPAWDVERLFMVDDILLSNGKFAPFMGDHMEQMHGRFGNALLTNGHFEVESDTVQAGHVERWHLVNPANARTSVLRIRGAEWRVVATDGGALPEPYETDRLAISPGQRFELEVRYADAGEVALESLVDSLDANDNVVTTPVPLFTSTVEASAPAAEWRFVARSRAPGRRTNARALLELDAVNTPDGLEWRINGHAHAHAPLFTFQKGDVVEMTLRNLAGPEHPFHLHGQFFELFPDSDLTRAQPGLKDVVLVPGLSTVRIRAYMDNPGSWMMHCHILEHAELGMMATFVVEE